MKEINIKTQSIEVKAEIRKLRVDNYTIPFDTKTDKIEILNVTGKSDEELHEFMMQDPSYRKMFEDYVKEEIRKDRYNKIKRIIE
jgi:hypothetical protein